MENNQEDEIFKNFEIPLKKEQFVHSSPVIEAIQHETDKEMHEYITASNYRTYMSKRGLPLSEITRKEMVPNMAKIISQYKTSEKNKITSPAQIDREVLLDERHKNNDLESHFINKIHELCDRAGLNYLSYVLGSSNGFKDKNNQEKNGFSKNEYYSLYTDLYKDLLVNLQHKKNKPEYKIMINMAKEIKDFLEKQDFEIRLDKVKVERRINQFEKYCGAFETKAKNKKKPAKNTEKKLILNKSSQAKLVDSSTEPNLTKTNAFGNNKMKTFNAQSLDKHKTGTGFLSQMTDKVDFNAIDTKQGTFMDSFKANFVKNDPGKKYQSTATKFHCKSKLQWINPGRNIDPQATSDLIDHKYVTHTQRHKLSDINKLMLANTQPKFFKNLTTRDLNYEKPSTNYEKSLVSKKEQNSIQGSSKENFIFPKIVGNTTSSGYDYTKRQDLETGEDMSHPERFNITTKNVWTKNIENDHQIYSKEKSNMEKISAQNEESQMYNRNNQSQQSNGMPKTSQDFNKEFFNKTNLVEPQRKQRQNWTQTTFKGLEFKRTKEWKKHIDKVFDDTNVFKTVKYTILDDKAEASRKKAKRAWLKKKMQIAIQSSGKLDKQEILQVITSKIIGKNDSENLTQNVTMNLANEQEIDMQKYKRKSSFKEHLCDGEKAKDKDYKSQGINHTAVKEEDYEGSLHENFQVDKNGEYEHKNKGKLF